jgi:hypothetical protein
MVKVTYPAGEPKVLESTGTEKIPLYEGKVPLTVRLRIARDARPGTTVVKLRLSYQACDDRLCLAPATLEIPLEIPVGR